MIIHVQENGWMDDEGCIKWINKVWVHRRSRVMKSKSLLDWDVLKSHLCEKVKAAVKRCNNDITVIPGGLTSVIHPLDVCLNKLFKNKLRQCWNE